MSVRYVNTPIRRSDGIEQYYRLLREEIVMTVFNNAAVSVNYFGLSDGISPYNAGQEF